MGSHIVGIICSIALVLIVPISVLAAPLPDDNQTIGIQLSQTCTTMIKNNITTNCPTYEQLVELGWDTSLHGSGEFGYINGLYQRGTPQYKDIHELYRYNDYHILIDPPNEIASRAKLIIINPTLPEYVPLGAYVKEDHVRKLHRDRYVSNCSEATITAENWEFFISDTVYYLRNNCTHTNYDNEVIIRDYVSSMNRETSKQYKHDKWLEESMEKCKEKC